MGHAHFAAGTPPRAGPAAAATRACPSTQTPPTLQPLPLPSARCGRPAACGGHAAAAACTRRGRCNSARFCRRAACIHGQGRARIGPSPGRASHLALNISFLFGRRLHTTLHGLAGDCEAACPACTGALRNADCQRAFMVARHQSLSAAPAQVASRAGRCHSGAALARGRSRLLIYGC